jgi:hypothetical protein
MSPAIDQIKQRILPILNRHGVKRAALFGSVVRGEMRDDSDIDILVDIDREMSLLDFVGIKLEIEDVLQKRVDLVEYDTIKPLIKDRILKEQEVIYEARP